MLKSLARVCLVLRRMIGCVRRKLSSPQPQPLACAVVDHPSSMPLGWNDISQLISGQRFYIALHEAGHIAITYSLGQSVEFVEILEGGGARSRVNRISDQAIGQQIACGGYAVELLLYKAGKIVHPSGVAVNEKEFIDLGMNNADKDKVAYFGQRYSDTAGMWPTGHDRTFMARGDAVSKLITPYISRMIRLAQALDRDGRLERDQIGALMAEDGGK